ncbi:metallophosphoesterase family protein [Alteromonas sp. A079]|uniref:metallophosphoesterase family protein n=1 Tax=Alteromonas sp. A079 TaxID=3410268 RepID=UPI003BA33FDE
MKLTLLHISDLHLAGDKQKKGYDNAVPIETFTRVLAHALLHTDKIDGLLVTGDISGDNSKASYDHFLSVIQTVRSLPVWVIPGNHDNNQFYASALQSYHLSDERPAKLGRWCLHGLDTRRTGTSGEVRPAALRRVAANIQASPQYHHLVALHHHVMPSNSWMDKHELVNADEFVTWLDTQPQIRAILHGHVHSPLRQVIGNNRCLSFGAPSTCWQWELTPDFNTSAEGPGYQLFSLYDDGNLMCEVKRVNK